MSKKKVYTVPVKFIFEGEFYVEADSAAEARDIVSEDCHLVMGNGVQSDSDNVEYWDVDMHSEKTIGKVTRRR